MISAALFWSAAGLIAYTYLIYPILILLRALVRPRPVVRADIDSSVSIVIAARNEEAAISRRIENLLALKYPGPLEIVIASDGSDDGTNTIVEGYHDREVRLVALPRVGKGDAVNAGVAASMGEILVFSDANSHFPPDTIIALTRAFADPAVGGVAGDQRYVGDDDAGAVAYGEQRYWNFDRWLKQAQSRAGSVISATGAIYAIRRELYEPIPRGVMDDFYVSTAVTANGHRLVFEPKATAYESVAPTAGVEFGRKVRVITQGLRAVTARRRLLDPSVHGFYALQVASHKVLRRLMVLPLAVMAIVAPFRWARGWPYRTAAVAQAIVYSAAAVGAAMSAAGRTPPRPARLPMYFCMVNAACLVSLWNLLRGRRLDWWEPVRDSTVATIQPDAVAPRTNRG